MKSKIEPDFIGDKQEEKRRLIMFFIVVVTSGIMLGILFILSLSLNPEHISSYLKLFGVFIIFVCIDIFLFFKILEARR